jgi:hypothetical protein
MTSSSATALAVIKLIEDEDEGVEEPFNVLGSYTSNSD